MEFDFNVEQKDFMRQARSLFERTESLRSTRRAYEENSSECLHQLWTQALDLGWLGASVPERYGGSDLGPLYTAAIAYEIGRSCASLPFSTSAYLAIPALLRHGSEDQKLRFLPSLVTGSLRAVLSAPTSVRDDLSLECHSGHVFLRGRTSHVLDGAGADFLIVLARGTAGPTMVLVPLTGERVASTVCRTIDASRSAAIFDLADARCEVLGSAGQGAQAMEDLLDQAAIFYAFEQVGGAERCLELARDYSLQRMAFGRPIGSFQAIKHKLADVYGLIELARSHAYYGAVCLVSRPQSLPLAASAARVAACEAFWVASKENIQVHGGNGSTWAADCHLYYRRAALLSLSLGSPRWWKDRLVAQLDAPDSQRALAS